MTVVLHAFPLSPRGFKVILAAEHLGVDYELRIVNLGAGDQHHPEFVEMNPNKRMPVLVDGDYVLWESDAIVEYLAWKANDLAFVPTSPPERLQVTKWLYWNGAHWDLAIAIVMFENVAKSMLRGDKPDPAEVERGEAAVLKVAAILDAELAKRPFVAGDRITAADVALAAPLTYVEYARLPLAGFANVERWRKTIEALPAWERAVAIQRQMLQGAVPARSPEPVS